MRIKKVAILGNGVMGSQIAAVFANADIPTLLFGYSSHNNGYIDKISKFRPKALTHADKNLWIKAVSFEHNLNELSQCDIVIEAVIEDLDAKQKMLKRVLPFLHKDVIIATNTSSLACLIPLNLLF